MGLGRMRHGLNPEINIDSSTKSYCVSYCSNQLDSPRAVDTFVAVQLQAFVGPGKVNELASSAHLFLLTIQSEQGHV